MNWISAEDKWPKYGETILIVVNGVVQNITYFRDGSDDTADWCEPFFFDDKEYAVWWKDVTHWMPLPAPPTAQAKYDWSKIPSWVEWIATSPDYKAWGFTHKPEICGDNNQDWGLRQEDSWSDVVAVSKFKGSWKDSLEQRPKGDTP
ncbi:conserved hypothetical protein [Acinetobacter proteolyticus]|uniref:DUF551 domain-containing protein n=1 Tax=Acinetobacter proteolyticus TaxID=1776741 RepID=A0A653K3F3_9GAMM|nr:DUF551 domain-containing protein [Acinetobacter proteolyticus]VXA55356.1 conserved hypothetical protein [Acinetobacter proteolyticus]